MSSATPLLVLVDTHNHIYRKGLASCCEPEPSSESQSASSPPQLPKPELHLMPMAVDEGDWEDLQTKSAIKGETIVAYGLGIHPWFAHLLSEGWQERLKSKLISDPGRSIVGECGLDRVAKTKETGKTEWETQLQVFYEHMNIAAELQRPVSLHCVKGHSFVYEWLKEKGGHQKSDESTKKTCFPYPPSLAFHSYTGSSEMASSLLGLPQIGKSIYFGFSSSVNLKSEATQKNCTKVLETLPPDRILLESDLDNREAVFGAMASICEFVAQTIGMEKNALMELTAKNAARFLLRRSLVV